MCDGPIVTFSILIMSDSGHLADLVPQPDLYCTFLLEVHDCCMNVPLEVDFIMDFMEGPFQQMDHVFHCEDYTFVFFVCG